jgi:hypothetical protein
LTPAVVTFPKYFPLLWTAARDVGLSAEANVFHNLRRAATTIAKKHADLRFLLFHSVKYGVSGEENRAKWQSDIDFVLICFNQISGERWFTLLIKFFRHLSYAIAV